MGKNMKTYIWSLTLDGLSKLIDGNEQNEFQILKRTDPDLKEYDIAKQMSYLVLIDDSNRMDFNNPKTSFKTEHDFNDNLAKLEQLWHSSD